MGTVGAGKGAEGAFVVGGAKNRADWTFVVWKGTVGVLDSAAGTGKCSVGGIDVDVEGKSAWNRPDGTLDVNCSWNCAAGALDVSGADNDPENCADSTVVVGNGGAGALNGTV